MSLKEPWKFRIGLPVYSTHIGISMAVCHDAKRSLVKCEHQPNQQPAIRLHDNERNRHPRHLPDSHPLRQHRMGSLPGHDVRSSRSDETKHMIANRSIASTSPESSIPHTDSVKNNFREETVLFRVDDCIRGHHSTLTTAQYPYVPICEQDPKPSTPPCSCTPWPRLSLREMRLPQYGGFSRHNVAQSPNFRPLVAQE
jgi:hypothetical protein